MPSEGGRGEKPVDILQGHQRASRCGVFGAAQRVCLLMRGKLGSAFARDKRLPGNGVHGVVLLWVVDDVVRLLPGSARLAVQIQRFWTQMAAAGSRFFK